MSPKSSRKNKRTNAKKNKENRVFNGAYKSKADMKKKTKGEIKHEKKLMKKKTKLSSAETNHDQMENKNNKNNEKDVILRNSSDDDNGCSFCRTESSDTSNGSEFDLSSKFVQTTIEKYRIKIPNKKPSCVVNKKPKFTAEELRNDVLDGFTHIKKGKFRQDEINETSEIIGLEAHKLITTGQEDEATEYLTKAIKLNSLDLRHHFNRSYSHMINAQYNESLTDIQYVLNHTDDILLTARMKCRQGQIYKLMKQYGKAEESLKACLDSFPHSVTVRCELARMRIEQLVARGFAEGSIRKLVRDHPGEDTQKLIKILQELDRPKLLPTHDLCEVLDDTEEYQSDSEQNLSNTRLFMKITNFDANTKDDVWFRALEKNNSSETTQPNSSKIKPGTIRDTITLNTNTGKESKVINASGIAAKKIVKAPDANINTKAVWVGSVNGSITKSALKRTFSQFGPVLSVHIPPASKCAFVNFKNEYAAQIAVKAEYIGIMGKILPIKVNKRTC